MAPSCAADPTTSPFTQQSSLPLPRPADAALGSSASTAAGEAAQRGSGGVSKAAVSSTLDQQAKPLHLRAASLPSQLPAPLHSYFNISALSKEVHSTQAPLAALISSLAKRAALCLQSLTPLARQEPSLVLRLHQRMKDQEDLLWLAAADVSALACMKTHSLPPALLASDVHLGDLRLAGTGSFAAVWTSSAHLSDLSAIKAWDALKSTPTVDQARPPTSSARSATAASKRTAQQPAPPAAGAAAVTSSSAQALIPDEDGSDDVRSAALDQSKQPRSTSLPKVVQLPPTPGTSAGSSTPVSDPWDPLADSDTAAPPVSALKVLQLPARYRPGPQRCWPDRLSLASIGQGAVTAMLLQAGSGGHYRTADVVACGRQEMEARLDDMRWLRLFLREYEALVHCEGHPCIVKVLGHCLGDMRVLPTLVLEYAGPVTLWQWMSRSSRGYIAAAAAGLLLTPFISWQQACAVYFQLVDSVDWMHWRCPTTQGPKGLTCIHRDLSLNNVMISGLYGSLQLPAIKLIDFGLCELKDRKSLGGSLCSWRQRGVPLGPNASCIDPLMQVEGLYGHGTDSFNIGQILMLLLFGASAEPPPCPESDDFLSAWGHRESLRKVLQLSPGAAKSHSESPLDPRWDTCPPLLLRLLMRQAWACTSASCPEDLCHRPTTRALLTGLSEPLVRAQMPPALYALLPHRTEVQAGTWEACSAAQARGKAALQCSKAATAGSSSVNTSQKESTTAGTSLESVAP